MLLELRYIPFKRQEKLPGGQSELLGVAEHRTGLKGLLTSNISLSDLSHGQNYVGTGSYWAHKGLTCLRKHLAAKGSTTFPGIGEFLKPFTQLCQECSVTQAGMVGLIEETSILPSCPLVWGISIGTEHCLSPTRSQSSL